jgi:hypothetical protein
VNQDLDLEAVWKFNQDFLSTYLDHPEQSVSTIISQTLPSTLKVQLPHWREVLATQELTDSLIGNEFQAPYRFLNAAIQAKRVKLPAYNLHVFDPNSASLRDLFPDLPRDTSKEDLLIATLRAWFTSHGSRVVPLALNFCTHTLTTASEMCDPHSINVVAMHTECATDGTCSDIFKTRNSWGTDTEGWFEAKPLARSILDAQTQITYLEPCRNADDITVSRNDTEVCAPEILGLHFGPENTVPAHLSSQKYLASHPLHYLAMSRDENQFFKQVDQLQTEGKLTPELYKTLAYGKTLGHLAVEDRALRIIQWLSANYRGLLEQNLDRVGNAAHFAVFLGHAPTIRTLMTEMPELYRTPDRQGWLPADIAADRANKPVLLELFKLQPALLTLKNSRDETPLSRLKRMHRPDYDRIRTIVKPRPWLLRAYRWLTHN